MTSSSFNSSSSSLFSSSLTSLRLSHMRDSSSAELIHFLKVLLKALSYPAPFSNPFQVFLSSWITYQDLSVVLLLRIFPEPFGKGFFLYPVTAFVVPVYCTSACSSFSCTLMIGFAFVVLWVYCPPAILVHWLILSLFLCGPSVFALPFCTLGFSLAVSLYFVFPFCCL